MDVQDRGWFPGSVATHFGCHPVRCHRCSKSKLLMPLPPLGIKFIPSEKGFINPGPASKQQYDFTRVINYSYQKRHQVSQGNNGTSWNILSADEQGTYGGKKKKKQVLGNLWPCVYMFEPYYPLLNCKWYKEQMKRMWLTLNEKKIHHKSVPGSTFVLRVWDWDWGLGRLMERCVGLSFIESLAEFMGWGSQLSVWADLLVQRGTPCPSTPSCLTGLGYLECSVSYYGRGPGENVNCYLERRIYWITCN